MTDLTSFNPYRRRHRDRSRSPYRARRSSRSPYRADRSRSRSPYRGAEQPRHGDKRRRINDHYGDAADTRRHKKSYEDPRSGRDRRGRYDDLDRPRQPDRLTQQSSQRGPPSSRNRLRSPYRSEKNEVKPSSNGDRRRSLDYSEHMNRESAPETSKRASNAKSKPTDPDDEGASQVKSEKTAPAISEIDLIEQRRKRREQIRAKHNSSLLVKVLEPTISHDIDSAPSTPQHDEGSVSSVANSPGTPQDASPPGTPDFAMHDAQDLIEPKSGNQDDADQGPSAADFNPEELNEDRLQYQPHHGSNSDERMEVTQEEPSANPVPAESSPKEFDMFADDDDDAMYAALDATAPKGKTLDQSIMDNWDHPDGHYRIIRGEILDHRYNVLEQIGKGTFATVVRAIDQQTGLKVAIKIACNNDTMLKAGRREVKFLKQLNEEDPDDKKHIIRFHREFVHKHHLCLVFEGLSDDLRALLKKLGRNVGLRLNGIRTYAYQLFVALDHMRKHEVLHADLKPDNILVNAHPYNLVKICDFGTALDQRDVIETTPFLVSRFYRPPEIIIGVPYDSAIDMWAIGCTLFELYTDKILFRGATNNGMLREIQACLGKLPQRVIKKGQLSYEYFDTTDPAFPFYAEEQDSFTNQMVRKPVNFKQQTPNKTLRARLGAGVQGGVPSLRGDELREHNAFLDLLEKCLQLDPEKRIKPKDAIRHPFLHRPPTASRAGRPGD